MNLQILWSSGSSSAYAARITADVATPRNRTTAAPGYPIFPATNWQNKHLPLDIFHCRRPGMGAPLINLIEGVAVGFADGGLLRAHRTARPGFVEHHHGLLENLFHYRQQGTGSQLRHPAGRKGDDDRDRSGRIPFGRGVGGKPSQGQR